MFLEKIQKLMEEGLYVVSYAGYCRGVSFTGKVFALASREEDAIKIAAFSTGKKYRKKGALIGCFQPCKATEQDEAEYLEMVKEGVEK